MWSFILINLNKWRFFADIIINYHKSMQINDIILANEIVYLWFWNDVKSFCSCFGDSQWIRCFTIGMVNLFHALDLCTQIITKLTQNKNRVHHRIRSVRSMRSVENYLNITNEIEINSIYAFDRYLYSSANQISKYIFSKRFVFFFKEYCALTK